VSNTVTDTRTAPVRRIVVCVNGATTDRYVVEYAAALGKPAKAQIVVLHVVEIDWTLPLDGSAAGLTEEAQRVLDVAEASAERVGLRLEPVLLKARNVGAAIVDEAAAQEAELLVLGLPYRTRFGGDFVMGTTIPYVFKNAPCTVCVVREPMPEEGA
jgi:nucleotide-binding universal stress UspA family protein